MAILLRKNPAFNGPQVEPKWTRGAKDGVGTAYADSGLLWYTIAEGVVTEIYHPTIDSPQIRDLQFLVTDGSTFFHDGRRDLEARYVCLGKSLPTSPSYDSPAYRIIGEPDGHPYRIVQDVLPAHSQPCLLIRVRVEAKDPAFLHRLKVYVLIAPHLDGGGWDNTGYVAETIAGKRLLAQKDKSWLAVGASVPISRGSCGYVGVNDGWTDVIKNRREMTWEFDYAPGGNVALIGELDLSRVTMVREGGTGWPGRSFVLGVGFGQGEPTSEGAAARVALADSLSRSFSHHLDRFLEGWGVAQSRLKFPAADPTSDRFHLYRFSHNVLLCHVDKLFKGAMVASLSIPWGQTRSDQDGGYHLVWPRDMCNSALALVAAGQLDTALQSLIFLSCSQQGDGHFFQNFYVDGRPHWLNIQLDEIAFPILLAHRLHGLNALEAFDPMPMILQAAGALITLGPMTDQERWEENGGYSPSTLASNIAALVCAGDLVRKSGGDPATAALLEEHADFLETKLEAWTVTHRGTLKAGVPVHYVRISDAEDPDLAEVQIGNGGPTLPAREVVDAGFLELVRYGIRRADDPIIVDSLKVVDEVLKVDLGGHPCWKRYNHDGYGQHPDGRSFDGTGRGGPWPLLTGERGHYELALACETGTPPPSDHITGMEVFATQTGILPEQLWDLPSLPARHMYFGKPTGAAVPLAWAHAEYLKLVRSVGDRLVFDRIDVVAARYLSGAASRSKTSDLEIWNLRRQVGRVDRSRVKRLRIALAAPFRLRWSGDDWAHVPPDISSTGVNGTGVAFADIALAPHPGPIVFTFYWIEAGRWQGSDYRVDL
jgi:glucoamylase